MDHTCLNSSNVSASFANDLLLAEELYFRTGDREISDNEENESSDSDGEEESADNGSQAEVSQDVERYVQKCRHWRKWRFWRNIAILEGLLTNSGRRALKCWRIWRKRRMWRKWRF